MTVSHYPEKEPMPQPEQGLEHIPDSITNNYAIKERDSGLLEASSLAKHSSKMHKSEHEDLSGIEKQRGIVVTERQLPGTDKTYFVAARPGSKGSEENSEKHDPPTPSRNKIYDWDADGAFEPFVEESEADEPGNETDVKPAEEGNELPENTTSEEERVDDLSEKPTEEHELPVSPSEEDTEELPAQPEDHITEELPENEEREVMSLEVGRAEQAHRGEDSILERRDLKLFGVADGMGGEENGAEASRTAVRTIEEFYENREEKPLTFQDALQDVVLAMGIARQKVSETGGFTTATFGKIEHIDGKDVLVYGHAGDSRLYYEGDEEGNVKQISDDQVTEDGTTVINGLTPQWIEEEERHVPLTEPLITNMDEFGGIELSDGDRLMFCTDGITGDYDPNRPDKIAKVLRLEEIQEAFDLASAQEAAERLLKISRKVDDKSVLVIDLSEDDNE